LNPTDLRSWELQPADTSRVLGLFTAHLPSGAGENQVSEMHTQTNSGGEEHCPRVRLEAGASSATVNSFLVLLVSTSSHQSDNNIFLVHYFNSSLQLQPAEHGAKHTRAGGRCPPCVSRPAEQKSPPKKEKRHLLLLLSIALRKPVPQSKRFTRVSKHRGKTKLGRDEGIHFWNWGVPETTGQQQKESCRNTVGRS